MRPYYEHDGITIYHGDAVEVLASLDVEVDSVVTDPPYKISQEYSASVDSDNVLAVSSIWPIAGEAARATRAGGVCALFYDTRILPLALAAFRNAGWKYLRALTHYRRWGAASKMLGWMSTSDFILVFAKPGAPHEWHAETRHDVYVKSAPDPCFAEHPAQKPLHVVAHLVENVTPPGGVVLDPYSGSGTVIRAAKDLGRRAIGIEIEERYCEIAAKRLGQGVLPFA